VELIVGGSSSLAESKVTTECVEEGLATTEVYNEKSEAMVYNLLTKSSVSQISRI
jgi:hypothetical protein